MGESLWTVEIRSSFIIFELSKLYQKNMENHIPRINIRFLCVIISSSHFLSYISPSWPNVKLFLQVTFFQIGPNVFSAANHAQNHKLLLQMLHQPQLECCLCIKWLMSSFIPLVCTFAECYAGSNSHSFWSGMHIRCLRIDAWIYAWVSTIAVMHC